MPLSPDSRAAIDRYYERVKANAHGFLEAHLGQPVAVLCVILAEHESVYLLMTDAEQAERFEADPDAYNQAVEGVLADALQLVMLDGEPNNTETSSEEL